MLFVNKQHIHTFLDILIVTDANPLFAFTYCLLNANISFALDLN